MTVALEEFVKHLEVTGLLGREAWRDLIDPQAAPTDAAELAQQLVRRHKLTPFQAEELCRGNWKSLVLGNYVLLEKIGAGGMGQVFKARHRRMDRLVAVKLLPPDLIQDEAAIARFEREVKAAARLRHPNIVAADDADCANGVHFLVLELVEGCDLLAFIRRQGPVSVQTAVNYISQAARGLEFAHSEGIIHRDIKPANLLLDHKGTVKVLDMGLARLHTNDAQQADLTSTGSIMGSVDYMAPEQALDTKSADARADIYALGCSMYQLLTGQPIYAGDTLMKKVLAHREQPIPSLRESRPDVPEQLEFVFQKMVAKQVEQRYQTMTHVLYDLQRCDCGSPANSSVDDQKARLPAAIRTEAEYDTIAAINPKDSTHVIPGPKTTVGNSRRIGFIAIGIVAIALLAGIAASFNMKAREAKESAAKEEASVVEVKQPDAVAQVESSKGSQERSKVSQEKIGVSPKDGLAKSTIPEGNTGRKLAFRDPQFRKWMQHVATLPAEEQVAAVSKKLTELNPQFDGQVLHEIEEGVVTRYEFLTDHITDISPVGALTKLKVLWCNGTEPHRGQLADLAPLSGMSLTTFECQHTQVADLSPLIGLPLTELVIAATKVSDLSPLKGMKLTSFTCCYSRVRDLSALKGMPLESLLFMGTAVKDLSPLIGMPLISLECFESKVSDLSPLSGIDTLRTLRVGSTLVADLAPLKGLSLDFLVVSGTAVTDLAPLAGMSLVTLDASDTKISSLSVLKGMPLSAVNVARTRARDLSPLTGMAITDLACDGSMVTDLTPLRSMMLQHLSCDLAAKRDSTLLRGIKTLETINGRPAAEILDEVDQDSK